MTSFDALRGAIPDGVGTVSFARTGRDPSEDARVLRSTAKVAWRGALTSGSTPLLPLALLAVPSAEIVNVGHSTTPKDPPVKEHPLPLARQDPQEKSAAFLCLKYQCGSQTFFEDAQLAHD